jgi:hypothetical protein
MIFWILASVIAVTFCAGLALVRVAPPAPVVPGNAATPRAPERDLSALPDAPPGQPIDLLFIHHSVGGQWLADAGDESGADARRCIYDSHPNGGGLRRQLEQAGYRVHEAAYSSTIGEHTDLLDWPAKFREQFDRIRRTAHQDRLLDTAVNRVVMFKSCYPNNAFRRDGAPPALTVANARAAMRSLRDELARHPDTLFVYVTAPPLRARAGSDRLWKWAAKRLLGKPDSASEQMFASDAARAFNDWMKSPTGWLDGYTARNVVVFDYFDILTGDGRGNFLQYACRGGTDDHPSSAGQQIAAARFVPFLNRAVRYAGLDLPGTPVPLASRR